MSDAAPAPASWSHFPHGADIGVRGEGPTAAAAFAQAALALTAITVEPAAIEPRHTLTIQCQAPDLELLLVDWLNALITRAATDRMLFARFTVTIEATGEATGEAAGWRLNAEAAGEPVDPRRHDLIVEAKGATMTALTVRRRTDGNWLAECVIDV